MRHPEKPKLHEENNRRQARKGNKEKRRHWEV